MQDWVVGLIVFVVLELIGGLMLRSHAATWKQAKENSELNEKERKFASRQYRRRRQASGMIMLLGVLIPGGLLLLTFKVSPVVPTLYWLAIICVTLWICLLAVGDLMTSAVHARKQFSEVKEGQRILEMELEEAKEKRNQQLDNGKQNEE